MSTEIKMNNEAQSSVMAGIDKVANLVKMTIGPKGRNVLIRRLMDPPIITNDGVTIAKNIELTDKVEDAGAMLVKSNANKTNEVAGDGTTTTTILTQSMIHEFNKFEKELDKINVEEMRMAADGLNKILLDMAIPSNSDEKIERVATISSGNEIMGKLIAKSFEQAGEFGAVIVEDNNLSNKDELESVQGMKFNMGSITPLLLDRKTMKTVYQDAKVLITTEQVDNIVVLMPLIEQCIKENIRLLLLCPDMDISPLNTILMNKQSGIPLNIAIVRLPGFGQLREELTEDICLATGATLISREKGRTLRDVTLNDLGDVNEVIVSQDDTVLKFKDQVTRYDTIKQEEVIVNLLNVRKTRAEELSQQMPQMGEEDYQKIKRRIANLVGGISVIKVGGNSEVEITDKKLRIEDAINSVQSAKEEGIVPGGGYSFLNAARIYKKKSEELTLGELIVLNSLDAITHQIAENAGYDGKEVVKECKLKSLGFNALTGEYEDLIKSGIINSVKTDRFSLVNSVSLASSVITMNGTITDESPKE